MSGRISDMLVVGACVQSVGSDTCTSGRECAGIHGACHMQGARITKLASVISTVFMVEAWKDFPLVSLE